MSEIDTIHKHFDISIDSNAEDKLDLGNILYVYGDDVATTGQDDGDASTTASSGFVISTIPTMTVTSNNWTTDCITLAANVLSISYGI